jgi:hypothetical protein
MYGVTATRKTARKEHWLAELQSPESLTGLARQRAVMGGLFPAAQTGLQVGLLDDILAPLPQLSHRVDPYFISSYVSLLQPSSHPGPGIADEASTLWLDNHQSALSQRASICRSVPTASAISSVRASSGCRTIR